MYVIYKVDFYSSELCKLVNNTGSYMYIHVYECLCVYMYMYLCVCMYMYVCVHVHVCVLVCVHVHILVCVHVHVCVLVCVRVQCTCTCVCFHVQCFSHAIAWLYIATVYRCLLYCIMYVLDMPNLLLQCLYFHIHCTCIV